MTRVAGSLSVVMFVLGASALAQTPMPRPVDGPAQPERSTVTITGCVQGDTLTSVSPDTTDGGGIVTAGRMYRLTGKRAVLNQIRRHHDGHLLEVSGTLKDAPDPPVVTRRKKLGKTAIYVGQGESGTPADMRAVEAPRLDVDAFRVVQPACPRSNLRR